METIVYRQDGDVPVLPGATTHGEDRLLSSPQEGRCAPCAHAVAPNKQAWDRVSLDV